VRLGSRVVWQDPGDLEIKAGARVFVTDKASEDWSVFFSFARTVGSLTWVFAGGRAR